VDSWETVAQSPAFQRLAREVLTLAAPSADDRVIDLGCGTGLLSLAFAPQVERVVAIDSSPAMLQRLAEKAAGGDTANIETVVADLRSLPLPDESATLAVSNYALHHLDDHGKELALSEIRRVLVPGGRLVICDMMFALSLRRRDVAVIGGKLALLARRGPAGLLRIARNGARIVTRRWEHPAPASSWERMLADRHFQGVQVALLEHEAGIALAERPPRTCK
jgi:SAM-dependent methyltransferase